MKKIVLALVSILLVLFMVSCNENTSDPKETETPEVPKISSINGIELSKFAIVYSADELDYNLRAAEYIKTEILARTELDLPLITDADYTTVEYEIVVGETNREISNSLNAETSGTEFAILADDNQVALEGDYFTIAAAAYYFVDTYVPADDFPAEIPLEATIHEPIVKEAKNYIMLIGDGMGVNQTHLLDFLETKVEYSDGEDLFYGYLFPAQGHARTNSLSGTTDSAASGTALATGYKTYNGYIGQDRLHKEIQSITELAAELGKATCVMSTEGSTGATPGAFSAHADSRTDTDAIALSQNALRKEKGTIIKCGFDYYESEKIAIIEKILLRNLDNLSADEDGFFMMYEEAYIDKHSHNNDIEKATLAVARFNQVIARCMEFAFYNPETFILITADHETGKLEMSDDGVFTYNSGDHTPANVPVFAYGEGSELFDEKVIENVQIPQTIASFMGVDDFGDQRLYKRLNIEE